MLRPRMSQGALEQFVGSMSVDDLARRLAVDVGELVERAANRRTDGRALERSPAVGGTLTMQGVLDRLGISAGLAGEQLVVAERILRGETDKEIADRLGCSERTAKRKVADVLRRCGAPTRAGILSRVLTAG